MARWPKEEERFWSRVERTPTCWLWRGALRRGYGNFSAGGEVMAVHRYGSGRTVRFQTGSRLTTSAGSGTVCGRPTCGSWTSARTCWPASRRQPRTPARRTARRGTNTRGVGMVGWVGSASARPAGRRMRGGATRPPNPAHPEFPVGRICKYIPSPHRPEAQDVALSRTQHVD
jgi:hypothetical protein